jgi:hypothetical protein
MELASRLLPWNSLVRKMRLDEGMVEQIVPVSWPAKRPNATSSHGMPIMLPLPSTFWILTASRAE